MKTILNTLEAARLVATPSAALDLADALADLHALANALDRHGWTLDEAPGALDDLKALQAHVSAQPFDLTTDDDSNPQIDETTPSAFADWLDTLGRLAG